MYSKIMCWVALNRGIKIAKRYGFDAPLEEWKKTADEIKEEVLLKGFDPGLNSFVQKYGSKELDSSLLLAGLMGFLPIDDVRIQSTIDACRKRLMKNGFLLRYENADGLSGEEGAFLLCNFWLVESLSLSDKLEEAEEVLEETVKAANHLGLFSEEYDFRTERQLGNFPQAFSHIGYINAVVSILNAKYKMSRKIMETPMAERMRKLIPIKVVLNKGDEEQTKKRNCDISAELKAMLNNLQGSFFDPEEDRVDYHAMRESENFKKYLELARQLKYYNPFSMHTDEEKKSFWINIYNILIIHGVIYFDIKQSVREVFNLFRRIGYNIGGYYFTPDDIEHGILRGNRPHPALKFKQFKLLDKRKILCVSNVDYRVHFALVCASSSCPPITFYAPENIDSQLDTAARSFINRGGIQVDKVRNVLKASQIFKWYEHDFGTGIKDIIKKVNVFEAEGEREYIIQNINSIKIQYLPYDWNLNSTLRS